MLQNKNYIRFAEKNTVEVVAMSGLMSAVERGESGAARYTGTRDGQRVELMVNWPNLTLDEMLDLSRSQAVRFNKSGQVPYTSIVNPHDETEIAHVRGSYTQKTLVRAVEEAREQLEQYGEGVTRDDLRAVDQACAEVEEFLNDGEFEDAIDGLDKVVKRRDEWPDSLRDRMETSRARVVDAARRALDEIEAMAETDRDGARRLLIRVQLRLAGTGLEERADQLRRSLAGN